MMHLLNGVLDDKQGGDDLRNGMHDVVYLLNGILDKQGGDDLRNDVVYAHAR